jgi:hypothetical protein
MKQQLAAYKEQQQEVKRQKSNSTSVELRDTTTPSQFTDLNTEVSLSFEDETQWPFELFCDQLFIDLFEY